MAFFEALKDKAVNTFNQVLDRAPANGLSRDEAFCREHNLPDGEVILDESAVEICCKPENSRDAYNVSYPQGRIYLTQHFLVFRDVFDRRNCSFVIHLSTVKKVERLPTSSYGFALSIGTHSRINVKIYLVGLRSESERFSSQLKMSLKKNLPNVKKLPPFIQTCYSEYLLAKNKVSNEKVEHMPPGGLGVKFKFPGDAKANRDKTKMKLWFDLFRVDGRNLSLIKTPMFYKLVRVGLPNRLRGEIWELCCGSIYLRLDHTNEYETLLKENEGKKSVAIEEIQKDLNRSLPEYAAYQDKEGIDRLRRVLTAYSWKNPDIGYCQAMNIVVAALLIYMSEEQAFWCLNVLIDRVVPGYYSRTMYGTLLDQRVFESLVENSMPVLWNHISKYDIQLSVISLPWFLSLYLTSMPLVFAFRILDVFFLQGPKTLFQVALAILKVNGEELLKAEDDGTFVSILKEYFLTLDQSAHPNAPNPKYSSVTKFQELMVTAFKEFSVINEEVIERHRAKHRNTIFSSITTFVKRTELRHLPKTANLSQTDISLLYDRFYSIVTSTITVGTGASEMHFDAFKIFMQQICDWVETEPNDDAAKQEAFLQRLFDNWDSKSEGSLSLADLVVGLNKLLEPDLLTSISNFFSLYSKDDKVDREGILTISEDLLYITSPWKKGLLLDSLTETAIENAIADELYKQQKESGNPNGEGIQIPQKFDLDKQRIENMQLERYLSAASTFIQRAFEYAQPVEDEEVLIEELKIDNTITSNAALNPSTPVYLNLPTFRMVVLADETYELFFSDTFRGSFHIDKPLDSKVNTMRNLRDMFDGLIADGREVAKKVRRRMDSQATPPQHSDNSSVQSGKSSKAQEEEDERDDDFGVIDIDENDKNLVLGAEAQVMVGSVNDTKEEEKRIESLKKAEASEDRKKQNNDGNLIEFET
ncbi:hypothetical protein CA3LBN_001678 [Candidozyma haemuli]|uniref:Rab-GAP TBC domain-containing protein n=1 Tax=Candidozyma haemuli TaxID=45357 RepID=A0ABX8I4M2_9ASCO|nr:hypothetical protein CA3LBN_001678 [[Candida] haemuloni]